MDDKTYVLTGPNGGGKSTLFRVLSGVRNVRNMSVEGEAIVYDQDPLKGPLKDVGIIFQEHFRRYLGSTPEGEIKIHLWRSGVTGKAAERRIRELAYERDLRDIIKRPINTLSDGEKLRVILAAIFATKPLGYILDEPLSSLDPVRALRVARLIKDLEEPTLVFEHRREFFGKAHAAIVNGTLEKAKKRKEVIIRSRWEGGEIEVDIFHKRVRVPLAKRGIVPIRGPNGGGKTTLLREMFKKLRKKMRVAYLPSDPNLFLHKPKAEEEANRIYKGPIRRLSFGQKKELSVVATLQRKASVYLLDEPFKGLDDQARERVLKLIEKKSQEASVYIATNERESIKIYGPRLRVQSGDVYEESGPDRFKLTDSYPSRTRSVDPVDDHSGIDKSPEEPITSYNVLAPNVRRSSVDREPRIGRAIRITRISSSLLYRLSRV